LNPGKFTIFSTDGVSGVKNLDTYILDFSVMSVVWSVWVHNSFYGFSLSIRPGFIFEPYR